MTSPGRGGALPPHDDMVAAIIDAWRDSEPSDVIAGLRWYPMARRMVDVIARESDSDPRRVAHALAALSPRNPWRWNVADAYAYAVAASLDPAGDLPPATTFSANRRAAWAALTGPGEPWTGAAPKVRAFVAAIMGDLDSVTVDAWAMRVATRGALDTVRAAQYASVAVAYRDAAAVVTALEGHVTPRDLQAVTWRYAERVGLGSRRRGRHGETFKAGTPPAVRALFLEDAP